nr:10919_t:CDS:2 [Entrophospora candida]
MPIHKPYASYIRSWKAKSPIIQLHLVLLEIDSFQETNKLDHVKKPYNNNKSVGLPKFRYKYLEHKLTLYLVHNGQIFIPLEALEGIEKISDRINYNWNSEYTAGKKKVITENMKSAKSITLYMHKDVSEQEIDIAGLHINYMIKARKNKSYSSWKDDWGKISDSNNYSKKKHDGNFNKNKKYGNDYKYNNSNSDKNMNDYDENKKGVNNYNNNSDSDKFCYQKFKILTPKNNKNGNNNNSSNNNNTSNNNVEVDLIKLFDDLEEEQLIIKLHHSNTDEVKNYLITKSYKLSNLTNLIEKSYNFATGTIKQLKYKDYFNNFVKITNDLEFQIAISIYKIDKNNPNSSSNNNEKFELWYDQQDQQFKEIKM